MPATRTDGVDAVCPRGDATVTIYAATSFPRSRDVPFRTTDGKGDATTVRSLLRVFNQQPLAAKVPEVTALFWVIKISTTAAGEAISDMFVIEQEGRRGGRGLHVRRRAVPAIPRPGATPRSPTGSWRSPSRRQERASPTPCTSSSACPTPLTSLFWLVVLAAVFYLWNRSEHTLDIHSITTNRREKFYWCVVFATFALGTAVGDFVASTIGLGYLASACPLLRRDPDPVGRVEVPQVEQHLRLLVRLRHHAPDRGILRRLLQQVARPQRRRLRRLADGPRDDLDRGDPRGLHRVARYDIQSPDVEIAGGT